MAEEKLSLIQRLKMTQPIRLIVISFFAIILVGSILLTMPFSSRTGDPTAFVDALFTSTSATCVTGLVPFDTWTHWNEFGQLVILLLIQIGGLGVITFTTGFAMAMRRKLGFRDLMLARENTSGDSLDVLHLVRIILSFTFTCEGIGALLLGIRFVPKFGVHGIWLSIFHSVSAYCNAGFDILGFEEPNASLINYASDPLVCLTIGALIFIGGIGFLVVSDIYLNKVRKILKREHRTHLNFHSTVVIRTSLILLVVGAVAFLALEYNNTLRDLNLGGKLNASLFQSVSARTAGYASVNIGRELDLTKMITIILMFIGASPASTGGGIKTTTFMVLAATVFSVFRGKEDAVLLKRRVDKSIVDRALAIFFMALAAVIIATCIILYTNPHLQISLVDALFEATSAFGTVGLTAGITPMLGAVSKYVLSFTMFMGRVGPVSLALAVAVRKGNRVGAVLPEGKLIVG